MKKLYKLGLLLLCFFPLWARAQTSASTNAPTSGRSKQELEKESESYTKQKKIHDKEVKAHHKKLQNKKVLKRMNKSKRKAKLNNEHKREFFLIRWFSKKR